MMLRAFTLVEVIVAVGVMAVTVVAVLALNGAVSRAAGDLAGYDRAGQLVDPSMMELRRLRDLPGSGGHPGGLEALAAQIPSGTSSESLKLVAARDGSRVVLEREADNVATGILPGERYYLIEVRQLAAPQSHESDAGYLGVSLLIRWPFQLPGGPNGAQALAADPAAASVAVYHAALTP